MLQCDEQKPACSQCTNTKRQCPGYVARFDLVLRDQTKAVRRKAQRKKVGTIRLPSPPPSASSEETGPFTTSWALAGPSRSSYAVMEKATSDDGIPRMFNDFPEQQAICAFFLDFVHLPRNQDSVQGHLEHLLPLYKNTTPDSPLSLATSSVALVISGSSPTKQSDQQLGRSIFGRALRKTSAAIRHPVESKKDETLMAVLLLGLFEVCCLKLSHPLSSLFQFIVEPPSFMCFLHMASQSPPRFGNAKHRILYPLNTFTWVMLI